MKCRTQRECCLLIKGLHMTTRAKNLPTNEANSNCWSAHQANLLMQSLKNIVLIFFIPIAILSGCADLQNKSDISTKNKIGDQPQQEQHIKTNNELVLEKVSDKLIPLRAWNEKIAFDKIKGKTLLENKLFADAFKSTAGAALYKKIIADLHSHNRYFQTAPIQTDHGIMRVDLDNLAGSAPYDASFFISPENGFIDVCWDNQGEGKKHWSTMFLHNGRKITLNSERCSDLSYVDIMSQANYDQHLLKLQSPLIGIWQGSYNTDLGNGHYQTVTKQILISGQPDKVNGLIFKSKESYIINRGTYKCTNTNSVIAQREGFARVDAQGNSVLFEVKKGSNEKCKDVLNTDISYEIKGAKLQRVIFNIRPGQEGNIGSLRKVHE